jgi:hypothetical protein
MAMLFQWRGIAVDGMRLDVPMMFSEQLLRCKFGGLKRKRFVEEVTTEGWAISTDGGALAKLRLAKLFLLSRPNAGSNAFSRAVILYSSGKPHESRMLVSERKNDGRCLEPFYF